MSTPAIPFSADALEDQLLASLATTLPPYLVSMGLPHWRSTVNRNDMDKWSQEQLPCLAVMCPGTVGEPRKFSDNTFLVRWAVAVAMVVSANNEENTRNLAQQYAAAIRTCVMHNRGWTNLARGTDWADERYDALEPDDGSELSLAAGQVAFLVELEVRLGYPPPAPVPVTSVELDVELIPLEGT